MRNRILAGAAISLIALLGTSCRNGGERSTAGREEAAGVGAEAPAFTLLSTDNGSVSLDNYRGR